MSEHEHDEEEVDFIEIDFDDGSTVRCEVQGIFELDGDEYEVKTADFTRNDGGKIRFTASFTA